MNEMIHTHPPEENELTWMLEPRPSQDRPKTQKIICWLVLVGGRTRSYCAFVPRLGRYLHSITAAHVFFRLPRLPSASVEVFKLKWIGLSGIPGWWHYSPSIIHIYVSPITAVAKEERTSER
eukprot:scaffold193_cov101-Skeletonema_dohrnii-CCMP3373.AAC.4